MKIVSACLAGLGCRYDGAAKPCPAVMKLVAAGQAIPLCPEQLGGLTTPRNPAERVGDRVLSRNGADVTAEFIRGAEEAMKIVELSGADGVILKAKSPSCGCGRIYDGTFTGTVIPGDGVFAALCRARGLTLETEEDYL